MGDPAVAMRDPVFYRWHQEMSFIFQEYKSTLAPYTVEELTFPGVEVTGVKVQVTGGRLNYFYSRLKESNLDLSGGIEYLQNYSQSIRNQHNYALVK